MSPALVRSTSLCKVLSALVAALVAAATVALAQDAPQMSAEEKAMMEAWAKAATPGKQHQWLAAKAGQWDLSGRFWNDPSKPPTETKGSVERFLMLGGRVLSEKAKSPGFMGQDFEGFGLMGFDNVSQEFWTTWSDTMGTGLMVSKGSCDDKGACTFQGEYAD